MKLTIEEAAVRLGKTVRQVRYAIQQNTIRARKVGGRWVIEDENLPEDAPTQKARQRKQRQLKAAVEDVLELPNEPTRTGYSVRDLKAFQIAHPLHERARRTLGPEHPAVRELHQVITLLTLGCHRFERPQKAAAYVQARDAASRAMSELLVDEEHDTETLVMAIENDLMKALAGLLRKMTRQERRSP